MPGTWLSGWVSLIISLGLPSGVTTTKSPMANERVNMIKELVAARCMVSVVVVDTSG